MTVSDTLSLPEIRLIDGKPRVSSRALADRFKKRHADVMRTIQRLECSPEFTQRNFALSEYVDPRGRRLPAYELTRDGFMMIAMGFTGRDAVQLKEAHINRFNALEETVLNLERQALAARQTDRAQTGHEPVRLTRTNAGAALLASRPWELLMMGHGGNWRRALEDLASHQQIAEKIRAAFDTAQPCCCICGARKGGGA